MKEEIKEKIYNLRAYLGTEENWLLDDIDDYITELEEENERLKNGYCELKVKCNNGECDCTNEEYEGMVQANMRGSLVLDDYKSRNEKAIEYIKHSQSYGTMAQVMPHLKPYVNGDDLLEILGEDKE